MSTITIHLRAHDETKSHIQSFISNHFSVYWKKWTYFLASLWYTPCMYMVYTFWYMLCTPSAGCLTYHYIQLNICDLCSHHYHYSTPLWWIIVLYIITNNKMSSRWLWLRILTHQKRDQFRNKPVFLFSKKSTDFQKL